MSDMKPAGTKITLAGKEYGIRFTLNAIDDIQETFNIPISQLTDLLKDERKQIRNIRYLLTLLINEDSACVADETGQPFTPLDERYVGRHIDTRNISTLVPAILKAVSSGTPDSDEDDDPNPPSGA